MKVFVTGGAGYIGSICVEELLNAGHQVTVFDNLSEGHRVAVDERAQFIEGCLSDRETILNAVATDQSEAVMHFAAFAQVGESMSNPSKYFRNNVANGINLLDAAQVLRLHPIALDDADHSEDFVIPLAATPGGVQFAYKHDEERVFLAEFMGYPDSATGLLYYYGDDAATP